MTIESVKYYPMTNSYAIEVTFYSRDDKLTASVKPKDKLISIYNKIDQEYQGIDLTRNKDEKIDINYLPKSDPFAK